MELRTTEETVLELVGLYESLRQSSNVWLSSSSSSSSADEEEEYSSAALPPFTIPTPPPPTPTTENSDHDNANDGGAATTETATTTGTSEETTTPPPPDPPLFMNFQSKVIPISNVATAVAALTKIQSSLCSIQPKMDRFRKRLAERDPITDKPRYGDQTQRRVQALVHAHDFLERHIPPPPPAAAAAAAAESRSVSNSQEGVAGDMSLSQELLVQLQQRHTHQLTQEQLAQQEADRERQRLQEQARQEALQKQQEEAQRALEAAERQRQEQAAAEAELRRQAEAARQRRLAQERAEQEWVDNIRAQGVKAQLELLKESITKNNMEVGNDKEGEDDDDYPQAAFATAITSLHTIFQQINAHPEETKFRRIRRDHEKFTQDIGRHKGGVEVLLAAGFSLGAIDDVPCYLSVEPDLETDMDGWSAWFDLNKATLEILEQELIRLPTSSKKSKR